MKRIILLGPILFTTVLTTLTIIQYDFMRGLGWYPINAPTFDWPVWDRDDRDFYFKRTHHVPLRPAPQI